MNIVEYQVLIAKEALFKIYAQKFLEGLKIVLPLIDSHFSNQGLRDSSLLFLAPSHNFLHSHQIVAFVNNKRSCPSLPPDLSFLFRLVTDELRENTWFFIKLNNLIGKKVFTKECQGEIESKAFSIKFSKYISILENAIGQLK